MQRPEVVAGLGRARRALAWLQYTIDEQLSEAERDKRIEGEMLDLARQIGAKAAAADCERRLAAIAAQSFEIEALIDAANIVDWAIKQYEAVQHPTLGEDDHGIS